MILMHWKKEVFKLLLGIFDRRFSVRFDLAHFGFAHIIEQLARSWKHH